MPWAVFHRQFDFDLRPKKAACISVQPSDEPQRQTTALINAAVKAGAAKRASAPKPVKDD